MEKNNSVEVDNVMSNIQKMITCCICQERLVMPIQCLDCQNLFCQVCISKWNSMSKSCPFKCHNPQFKPCRIMENILTSLDLPKIKNKKKSGNSAIVSSFLGSNEETYEKKYFELSEKYNHYVILVETLIKKLGDCSRRLFNIKAPETKDPYAETYISKYHMHPLIKGGGGYFAECNECGKNIEKELSFCCYNCLYDLCPECKQKEEEMNSDKLISTNKKKLFNVSK